MNAYDYLIWRPTDELYHHGIKGQKWGDRNGPPYPLDSRTAKKVKKQATKDAKKSGTVIAKGTKLAVVDGINNAQKDGSINAYDTNNIHASTANVADAAVLANHGAKMYKHEYEATEDLIAPSEKVAIKAFSEAYADNKELFTESLNSVESYWKRKIFESSNAANSISDKMRWLLMDNMKYAVTPDRTYGKLGWLGDDMTFEEWKEAYQSSDNYKNISKGSFSSDKDLTDSEKSYAYYLYTYDKAERSYGYQNNDSVDQAYMNSLTSKGYNSIVNNGSSGYFNTIQNVVAINGSTTLKEIDTYEMASDEMTTALNKCLEQQRTRPSKWN